jgi:hypothetical protein
LIDEFEAALRQIGGDLRSALELRLPRCDLIGVDVELLRKLSQCSIALDGGKRHLHLEGRRVVPAGSSAHCSDSLGTPCPLSGRNSTYRPVQISETSSNLPWCRRSAKYHVQRKTGRDVYAQAKDDGQDNHADNIPKLRRSTHSVPRPKRMIGLLRFFPNISEGCASLVGCL